MKKLREFLGSGDRLRLLLSVFAVSVMLIVALLLPLAFRGVPEQSPETVTRPAGGEKRQLFADYWLLGPEESGLTVARLEDVSEETTLACEDVMRALVAQCINDKKLEYQAPDGSEYTVVGSDSGAQARLCRMWLEARGDWQNWLDVCFDADSGEVYYLYLSRECLSNRNQYVGMDTPSASYIASILEEDNGWALRLLEDSGEGSLALFTTDSGTACYQIDCRGYDALIDVKICCR